MKKLNPMTSEEATAKFTALMTPIADAAKALRGRVRVNLNDDRLSVYVERAFGVDANFNAILGYATIEQEGKRDGDGREAGQGGGRLVATYEPKTSVSWNLSRRSVAAATAALALYREVLELAAEAETLLGDVTWRVAV